MDFLNRIWFGWMYLGRPPWDTGVSPPELVAFMQSHPPGRALDLGCGSGTNAITLASQGWQVTGIDFVGRAIRLARRKARRAGLEIDFRQGDVARLDRVNGPFNLILDIGCFHSLSARSRPDYAANLLRMLAPGGTFLMYAWTNENGGEGSGLAPSDLELLCGSLPDHGEAPQPQRLSLVERQDGAERGRRPSAWFVFQAGVDG